MYIYKCIYNLFTVMRKSIFLRRIIVNGRKQRSILWLYICSIILVEQPDKNSYDVFSKRCYNHHDARNDERCARRRPELAVGRDKAYHFHKVFVPFIFLRIVHFKGSRAAVGYAAPVLKATVALFDVNRQLVSVQMVSGFHSL